MRTRLLVVVSMVIVAIVSGCGTTKEYVLMNDLDVNLDYKIPEHRDLRIKAGDDLRIIVSQKDETVAAQFSQNSTLNDPKAYSNYTVDYDGYINFPMLDTVEVIGMTCREVEQRLKELIEGNGLAANPSVNVKITNFQVTVIGESGTGVYEFDNPNVSILDLLAKANLVQGGGNGISIRRDKILVMRNENGVLHSEYLNLLTKDVMYSPFFYLQQNDVVYVYPSKTTIRQSNKLFDYWWSRIGILTTATSVVTLVLTIINNNKKE